MEILTLSIKARIEKDILLHLLRRNFGKAAEHMPIIQELLYDAIPAGKRISYGIVHTIKILSAYLYDQLDLSNMPVLEAASAVFTLSTEPKSQGTALGILSLCGLEDLAPVLPYFETAAASEDWNLREFAQMFFRKLIKKHPKMAKHFLLKKVKSPDPNVRRFVSETLRPVQENRWFYKDPDYSLGILHHLFAEKAPYPRTSVGNNLSDLARKLPELAYSLVENLVGKGDENSFWIAYRACRNLVKKDPLRVMDLLKIDEYRYKKRIYRRHGPAGN